MDLFDYLEDQIEDPSTDLRWCEDCRHWGAECQDYPCSCHCCAEDGTSPSPIPGEVVSVTA
jgi:hypothetical protein